MKASFRDSAIPSVRNPQLPQSDHSWSEYLVAYSLLYPGVVIILALLGGLGLGAFFIFAAAGYFPPYFLAGNAPLCVPCGFTARSAAPIHPPCPELDRIFQAAHRGSSLRMEKA